MSTILSVTSPSKERTTTVHTIEASISPLGERALNMVFDTVVNLKTPTIRSENPERVVCVTDTSDEGFSEFGPDKYKATVIRATQNTIGIHFRLLDTTSPDNEWVAIAGTPNEPRQTEFVPNDPQTLTSFPAGMAASFFGGYDRNIPIPGATFNKDGDKWICSTITDIPPESLGVAILAAFVQLNFIKNKQKVLDIELS